MRKKPKSNKRRGYAITGQEWLMLKPYERNAPYDYEYVKLANEVHELLRQHSEILAAQLPEVSEAIKSLSLIFTSYFEDILNEIGVWQVFLDCNQEKYGFYLPFGVNPGYEAGNLNYEDIHFLLWHFSNEHKGSFFAPDGTLFQLIAEQIYSLFFEKWDDLPLTEFYEEWLTLSDDIDFFDIKERLHWLGLKSYVLGFEFGAELGGNLAEFIMLNEIKSEEDVNKILYALTDDFLYEKRSSYSALNVPEWLSALCQASEKIKESILEMQHHFSAIMLYKGQNEQYYQCEYSYLRKVFDVVKRSVDIPQIAIDSRLFLHLVKFRGEYWFSGSLMTWPPGPIKEDEEIPFVPFFLYKEEDQQRLLESTNDLQKDFESFFGGLMVTANSREEMQQKLGDFWTFQHKKQSWKNRMSKKKFAQFIQMTMDNVPEEDDLVLFFEPKVGLVFQFLFNETKQLLAKEKLSQTEHEKLFFYLTSEISPNLLPQLQQDFPDRRLTYPDPRSTLDLWPALSFLSRYSMPEEYGLRYPQTMPHDLF